MPIRKIADLPQGPCTGLDHLPPAHIVHPPGIYEHECPSCGKKTTFTVPETMWGDPCPSPGPTPKFEFGTEPAPKFEFGTETGRFDVSKPNESNGYSA